MRLSAVLLAATAAVVAPPTGSIPPARAQGVARIDLVAQTTFVGPDPAVVEVRVLGAPAAATVSVRIHEAVGSRSALQASISGRPPTDVIGQWVVEDLDEARVGLGEVISLRVPDEEIGELLRRPSDAGAHPLVVDLVHDGEVLDSLVTHLLVVPRGEAAADRSDLVVALLFDLFVPSAVTSSGEIDLDSDVVEAAVARADSLAAWVEVPFTVRLSPETFDALIREELDGTLEQLRTASVGNQVLAAPWVDLDEEAWRAAGRGDLVAELYELGTRALRVDAAIVPSDTVLLDESATAETLSLLTDPAIGATGFVLGSGTVGNVPDAVAGPVLVRDTEGRSHPAVVPDDYVAGLLADSDVELAVQNTLTELVRMALAAGGPAGVVVAVDEIDGVTLDLLLTALDQPGPLVTGPVDDVLALDPVMVAGDEPVEARLPETSPDDVSGYVLRRAELESQLGAYVSVVGSEQSHAESLDVILLAGMATTAAPERDQYLATVRDEVARGLDLIRVVETGRITITSRRADLPVTISNDSDSPATVVLALSAEKIDFPGGDHQTIVLPPGETEIDLEVEALASGDSIINISVQSPEGGVVLTTGLVRLRSTAISGLGLLISLVALAVLLVWWLRTIRERRRTRRLPADSVAGSPDETSEDVLETSPAHGGAP